MTVVEEVEIAGARFDLLRKGYQSSQYKLALPGRGDYLVLNWAPDQLSKLAHYNADTGAKHDLGDNLDEQALAALVASVIEEANAVQSELALEGSGMQILFYENIMEFRWQEEETGNEETFLLFEDAHEPERAFLAWAARHPERARVILEAIVHEEDSLVQHTHAE